MDSLPISHPYARLRGFLKRTWEHSGFQKYLKNTGWMLGARFLTLAISFVAIIYIARNLGPTNYGQLSYATSFVALFGFIASLGIDSILHRDLVRHPEKRRTILGTALIIKLIAGTVAAITATLFAFIIANQDVSSILIIILASAFILNSFQIIALEFQARADSKYPSIVMVIIALLLNTLKILIIATGNGVIYLAAVLLLESVLYAAGYTYIYVRRHHEPVTKLQFDKTYAKSLLHDSLPLIVLSGFSIIYARIDQVFIKHMIDAHAVGIYDAAVRVAEIWAFIPGLIVLALAPALVNAKSTSERVYHQRIGRLAILLSVIALGVAFVMTLLAPFIMQVLYGNEFSEGIPILRIYIWAFIGTSLGVLVTQYLITENFRTILIYVAFFPMLVNIILNLLWIPNYGIVGSAYATLISYSLTPFMLLFFKKTRKGILSVLVSFTPDTLLETKKQ